MKSSNLSYRIKVILNDVYAGKSFKSQIYHPYYKEQVILVGVPYTFGKGHTGAILLIEPLSGFEKFLRNVYIYIMIVGIIAIIFSLFLVKRLSGMIIRPVLDMKDNAQAMAAGDYSHRLQVHGDDEIAELGNALNSLGKDLGDYIAKMERTEKIRRDFVANVSHELRTPVTVIRGSLEALRDGVVTEKADVEEFHEQMYKESLFLQRLINDLLDLSRLQNTDFPIEKAPLNFVDVMHDAVRSGRQLGADKKLQITGSADKDIYMLNGDYGRLRQMLMIFLHNSIKFSPEGSEIKLELAGNRLKLIDHGCGIKEEDIPHAFDRFYKARNEHNKSGSGLGLAIAKQIAQRHDMQLELQSKLGEGTTIIITLPPELKEKEYADE